MGKGVVRRLEVEAGGKCGVVDSRWVVTAGLSAILRRGEGLGFEVDGARLRASGHGKGDREQELLARAGLTLNTEP